LKNLFQGEKDKKVSNLFLKSKISRSKRKGRRLFWEKDPGYFLVYPLKRLELKIEKWNCYDNIVCGDISI